MEEPAETPVTTPLEFTVATEVVPDVQLPPEVVFAKVVVEPIQTLLVPVIAGTEGEAETVTEVLAEPVPQALVKV